MATKKTTKVTTETSIKKTPRKRQTTPKKISTSKDNSSVKTVGTSMDSIVTPVMTSTRSKKRNRFVVNLLIVVLLGVALFLVTKKYRNLVIAAVVDKTPISTFELNKALNQRYGKAVLDDIINEKLLLQSAADNKISITQAEADTEIQKLTDSLGGQQNLENAMTQYNITKKDLEKQVRFRLIQQKLTSLLFKVEITDQEVKDYYNSNKDTVYKGKTFDDVKDEITSDLKDQKAQQQFTEWFQNLKTKANITYYLTN